MKKLVTSYTFDASAQTIVSADFTSLEKIQLITNVTDQLIIYNFADTSKGGTLAGTTLTLEFDTTAMDDADKLQIFVEDAAAVLPVSASSLPLPSGAATSANQTTLIGHVDGIEGLLGTIDADTSALAGAVAGTEVQVDVLTMPTVTVQATNLDVRDLIFAADKVDASGSTLAANSGVDIGDVTINNASGGAAVNVQDGGNSLTVDYATTGSGNATGALRVELANNGTGVLATVGAVTAITNALPAGTNAIGKLAANSGVDIGDVDVTSLPVAFNTGTRSATTQRVTIATDDLVPVSDNGGSITVDAPVGTPAFVRLSDGVSAISTLPVSLSTVAVTNAGTFVTQENGAALTAMQLIDDTVFADDAAFTLSTSKANTMAGVAVQTDGTDPTAVSAEGDAAALRTDMQRNLIVNQTHPRFWHVSADYASAQTNTSVKAAPGASLSLYITDITLSNGATAGNITLLDGSSGTVLFEIYPAINGGAVLSLRSPIKLTANTALCITSTTVTTHSIFVSGYVGP